MSIEEVLARIAATPDCFILPSAGHPQVTKPCLLPNDLLRFYELCGGVILFQSAGCSTSVVPPHGVVPANPIIRGETIEGDISETWYILADDLNGDYFTIDLSCERLGRCYDSFWDSHAQVGDSPIVATTFTDFLVRMLNNNGKHWYFLQPDFISLGDAYDTPEQIQ